MTECLITGHQDQWVRFFWQLQKHGSATGMMEFVEESLLLQLIITVISLTQHNNKYSYTYSLGDDVRSLIARRSCFVDCTCSSMGCCLIFVALHRLLTSLPSLMLTVFICCRAKKKKSLCCLTKLLQRKN